ncbi:MAG: hypothetical protein M0P63_16110, partial [Azoarcus sp.]|nr:hypothetical protein [Azoarcus sp.]
MQIIDLPLIRVCASRFETGGICSGESTWKAHPRAGQGGPRGPLCHISQITLIGGFMGFQISFSRPGLVLGLIASLALS